jgi:hypothetical protein
MLYAGMVVEKVIEVAESKTTGRLKQIALDLFITVTLDGSEPLAYRNHFDIKANEDISGDILKAALQVWYEAGKMILSEEKSLLGVFCGVNIDVAFSIKNHTPFLEETTINNGTYFSKELI